MRKLIMAILMTLMIAAAAMARPVTKIVYEAESQGVILFYDTDTYGKDFAKDADINAVYGELKAHKNYFVWNSNEKRFEIGTAKGMDLWMNTFSNLFKYADDQIKEGYATAGLIFVTDGFENDPAKGVFVVTNGGIIYGYWDY